MLEGPPTQGVRAQWPRTRRGNRRPEPRPVLRRGGTAAGGVSRRDGLGMAQLFLTWGAIIRQDTVKRRPEALNKSLNRGVKTPAVGLGRLCGSIYGGGLEHKPPESIRASWRVLERGIGRGPEGASVRALESDHDLPWVPGESTGQAEGDEGAS